MYEIGYLSNGLEKYEDAIYWMNKANEVKPEYTNYNEIGFAYYKLKKNDESINAYKNAIELKVDNGTSYKGIGDVYRRNYSPSKTKKFRFTFWSRLVLQ
jgi:tetratricopeptide (TPR) repeat protein